MNPPIQPFRRHDPFNTPVPLVLDSPHSGRHYPEDFRPVAPMQAVRQAEDTYVEELFEVAPRLGATLVEATFPRAYVDANRALTDIDPDVLSEPWPEPFEPSAKTALGIGLVWRLARGGVPMYDRKLSVPEVRHRIYAFYMPYHAALEQAIEERRRAFGAVWHLNCHSMPSVGDSLASDPGRARADFVLGDRDGSTCGQDFTVFVADNLRAMGFHVAVNDPYKGVEIVRRHGRPQEHRHSLQIEINRSLYMDEATFEKSVGFRVLRESMGRLVGQIVEYVRQHPRVLERRGTL